MIQVGLDIGSKTVKVVGLKTSWGQTRLIGLGSATIPAGSVTKTEIQQTPLLADAIRKACAGAAPYALKPRRIVSALPASTVFTKLLDVPIMHPKELTQTIPYEAGLAFPMPIESLYLDWLMIPHHPSRLARGKPVRLASNASRPSEPTMEVLVIGVPRTLVDSYVAFTHSLGFELAALEIKPLANLRAIEQAADQARPAILVDIGATESSLAVIDRGVMRSLSTVNFGADLLKIVAPGPTPLGSPVLAKQPASKTTKSRPQATQRSSRPTNGLILNRLTPLIEEIDHLSKYYEHRLPEAGQIRWLRLTGGGAATPGIGQFLEEKTGLTTDIASPLVHLVPSTLALKEALAYTTAIGLALRKESL